MHECFGTARKDLSAAANRVESMTGAAALAGGEWPFPAKPVPQSTRHGSVSSHRSSHRTCGFASYGARTGHHAFRPRKVARSQRQTLEPQLLIEVLVGETCSAPTWRLVLLTQPPAKPLNHVRIDCPVRPVDRTQTEVVGPPGQKPIELCHLQFCVDQQPAPVRQLANGAAYLGDALLRRARANIWSTRFRRIAPCIWDLTTC